MRKRVKKWLFMLERKRKIRENDSWLQKNPSLNDLISKQKITS